MKSQWNQLEQVAIRIVIANTIQQSFMPYFNFSIQFSEAGSTNRQSNGFMNTSVTFTIEYVRIKCSAIFL